MNTINITDKNSQLNMLKIFTLMEILYKELYDKATTKQSKEFIKKTYLKSKKNILEEIQNSDFFEKEIVISNYVSKLNNMNLWKSPTNIIFISNFAYLQ